MKKITTLTLAGVFATTLASGAAVAGPKKHHGAPAHQDRQNHSHNNNDFVGGLAALALFAGVAIAIDAALDADWEVSYDDHDRHHRDRYDYNRHHHKTPKPNRNEWSHRHPQAGSHINQRQQNQKRRIKHGVQNGELSRKEAKRLRRQQRRIADLEYQFRADGHLTQQERRILQNRLDLASNHIFRLKHN